jgi:hypothetical protein
MGIPQSVMSNQPTAREVLREIDVAYQNRRIELPKELHGKIVNCLAQPVEMVETQPMWTKVSDQLPPEGRIVHTKIVDGYSSIEHTWCFISRMYSNGLWIAADERNYEWNYPKYNPTHWRL